MDVTNPHQLIDRRAALAGLAGLAALGPSSGTGATAGPGLHADIEALLRRTADIWNSQEFGRLKEVWDAEDPEPWYVPEEIAEPFRSWPEIENYWSPKGPRVLDAFRWEFSNLRVKALAPDLTLALFNHYYEYGITVPGRPAQAPLAGEDRCLALFRRKPDGWRHILYAQCPQGPESYVRGLRERIVRPDFPAFRDQLREQRKGAGQPPRPAAR
jgi:hypothetical protein